MTVDGIPVELRFSDAERELKKHPDVSRAIELAKEKGWRHALQTVWDAGMAAYSSDPKRAKFLEVMPLSENMTVLEIGVGLGQHTSEIASRVFHLDSIEVSLLNALFAKLRCEQEGVTNVTFICGGDDCRLPFAAEQYDAVILNLVFEWCGSENKDEPFPVAQRRLLSEVYRVLRPGGIFEINTKNRYSYRLLTGGGDEHSYGIRFGNALPRWLLRAVLSLRGKSRPPGYLHSWWALKRLLREAGFRSLISYWTVPEMRFPEYLIPADARSVRSAKKKISRLGESRRMQLLMRLTPASFVKFVAPGLFFIVRKST